MDENPFYDPDEHRSLKTWPCPKCHDTTGGTPDYGYEFYHHGKVPKGMPLVCFSCNHFWIDGEE